MNDNDQDKDRGKGQGANQGIANQDIANQNMPVPADASPAKKLTPAAQRALAEAAARRAAGDAKEVERPKEFQGRDGPDPARYGDWETKGIISDF